MALLYKSTAERGLVWKALFAEHLPELDFRIWPDIGDVSKIRYLATWTLPQELLSKLVNLEVIFSVGAGVDQLDLAAIPDHILVVRMIEPVLASGMADYVALSTLALHRNLIDYAFAQRHRRWEPRPVIPSAERRVSVMGLGAMGEAALEALRPFGFQLAAWSRTERSLEGVQCFAGPALLESFLERSDILICLLPLTSETRGILCRAVFDRLPPGAGLINAARGGHLVEKDLLNAIEEGRIGGAILDVFAQEPPAPDHPFWDHPKILMTPHVASHSNASSGGRNVLENVVRYERGEPMVGAVQRDRGY